jgi:MFS family permease
VVYSLLALVGVASLFGLNFTTLLPIFARFILNVDSSGFGFLSAAMGIGSLIGALSLAFLNRRDWARRLVYGGAFVFTCTEILFAFSRVYGLSIGLLVVIGLSMTLFTTTANTRILSLTPNHLQGRVMSIYSLMFLGMTPFGSLLSGLIAEKFGAPAALVSGGIVTLLFTLFVFVYRPSQRARRVEVAGLPTTESRPASTPS